MTFPRVICKVCGNDCKETVLIKNNYWYCNNNNCKNASTSITKPEMFIYL